MKNQKNITDRKQLKAFFKKGSLPEESAFEKLIDSTFNKADDRLDINEEGLMIYPSDNGKEKLLSFFEDKDDAEAMWAMFISKKENGGIYFSKIGQSDFDNYEPKDEDQAPVLFLQKSGGRIGVGTDSPNNKLDVRGIVASEGRAGNYAEGVLDADGEWHNVFQSENLYGCNAYEIMAYVEGDKGEGRYALMHAIAISTFGNSKPKITKTIAYHGKWWNKISIRWESRPSRIKEKPAGKKKKMIDLVKLWKSISGLWESKDPFNYNLQLKTKSNYGEGKKIYFKVSLLWDSSFIKRTN
ncbi:MAG TPA: hypothetical protein VKA27_00385 [Sunxiuqinia sp.]|nr:hypothetical protein [Sunxiuqinia sp.]